MPDRHDASRRDDEVDHDLLTFGEAGARLQEELAAHRELVNQLAAQPDSEELAQARNRLAALESAVERNRRRPISDAHFDPPARD